MASANLSFGAERRTLQGSLKTQLGGGRYMAASDGAGVPVPVGRGKRHVGEIGVIHPSLQVGRFRY
jgi:hypothetical protein